MDLANINWIAVAVATASTFVIGFIWYGPLFAKAWMKEVGMTKEDAKNANMLMVFGPAFVLTFIMGIALANLVRPHDTWITGMQLGAMIGVGFVSTSLGVNYLFARKSFTLFFIDSGYGIITLMLTGAILGAWH